MADAISQDRSKVNLKSIWKPGDTRDKEDNRPWRMPSREEEIRDTRETDRIRDGRTIHESGGVSKGKSCSQRRAPKPTILDRRDVCIKCKDDERKISGKP
jgi:hypothetical protein